MQVLMPTPKMLGLGCPKGTRWSKEPVCLEHVDTKLALPGEQRGGFSSLKYLVQSDVPIPRVKKKKKKLVKPEDSKMIEQLVVQSQEIYAVGPCVAYHNC